MNSMLFASLTVMLLIVGQLADAGEKGGDTIILGGGGGGHGCGHGGGTMLLKTGKKKKGDIIVIGGGGGGGCKHKKETHYIPMPHYTHYGGGHGDDHGYGGYDSHYRRK